MAVKKEFKKNLAEKRPAEWQSLPDLQLYMDQILAYLERQHIGLSYGEELTSAMVNNYIKKGLLPRASGKRYDREHIAHLTLICLFKQIFSVADTDLMMKLQLAESDIETAYAKYREVLDEECLSVTEQIAGDGQDSRDPAELALTLAVRSYISRLACEEIIKEFFAEEK